MQTSNNRVNISTTNIVNRVLSNKKQTNFLKYPCIDSEDFKPIMDNYRLAVNKFNNWAAKENVRVKSYNLLVKAQTKANKPSKELIEKLSDFLESINSLQGRFYNEKVEEFNKENTPLALKRRISPIKYQSELIFSVMLGFYASQLRLRNKGFIKAGRNIVEVLPKLKINSYEIANHKINEIERLRISSRTVQRHVKKYIEAGILHSYEFRGSKKPTRAYISSEILILKETKYTHKSILEKQGLTPTQTTSCRNISDVTKDLKNQKEIKGDVDNIANKESLSNKTDFNKNTKKGKQNFENVQTKNPSSEILKGRIQQKKKLAGELADHLYDHYEPIPIEILQKEALTGTISRLEFKTLLIQDFMKYSAQLYRESTPYSRVWEKTLYMFEDHYFQSPNGRLYHKETMLKNIVKWRWMIKHAMHWFDKTGRNVLFPTDYFDFTRNTPEECGFWYLEKAFDKNEKLKEKRKLERAAKVKKGVERKKEIKKNRNEHKLALKAVREYLNGKRNYTELFDYVESTLHRKFIEELPKMIDQENFKRFNLE